MQSRAWKMLARTKVSIVINVPHTIGQCANALPSIKFTGRPTVSEAWLRSSWQANNAETSGFKSVVRHRRGSNAQKECLRRQNLSITFTICKSVEQNSTESKLPRHMRLLTLSLHEIDNLPVNKRYLTYRNI